MKQAIQKLAFLSGMTKAMDLDGIMIRSKKAWKKVVLYLLSPLFLFYGFLIKTFAKYRLLLIERNRQNKYNLSVVVIAKNEGEYLEEWIAYYKVIGVDCIFLYDNESNDGTKEKIQRYIDEGFVIYHIIRGKGIQSQVYNDALYHYGNECKYMAFVDCDEFIMPCYEERSIKVVDIIDKVLDKDHNAGGLGLNWYIYGTSGHTTKTAGLVLEQFTYRARFDFSRNQHIKSIVKPYCVKAYTHPHYAQMRRGYYTIGLSGELIGSWYNPIKEERIIRINHYVTKSKEEWDKRRMLSRADNGLPKPTSDTIDKFDRNDVKDETALYYVDKVKETMSKYNNRSAGNINK